MCDECFAVGADFAALPGRLGIFLDVKEILAEQFTVAIFASGIGRGGLDDDLDARGRQVALVHAQRDGELTELTGETAALGHANKLDPPVVLVGPEAIGQGQARRHKQRQGRDFQFFRHVGSILLSTSSLSQKWCRNAARAWPMATKARAVVNHSCSS